MAAQERAKQAQMKQTTGAAAPPIQHNPTAALPAPEQMTVNAEREKEKMMNALNGIVDVKQEKENKVEDFKPPPLPPPQFAAPPQLNAPPAFAAPPPTMQFNAPPPTSTMMPPPPSFAIFEQQQMKLSQPPPPPPAFDFVENNLLGMPGVQASAPPPPAVEESLLDGFAGVTPMAPPPSYPVEQQVTTEEADVFEFDMDGNPLSAEDRRKMMEEQRAIMEQIQKQANENKASEAAVKANAFESRMMGNHGVSVPSTTTSTTISPGVSTDIDVSSIGAAEIEEQRRILEEIEKQKRNLPYQSPHTMSSNANAEIAAAIAEEARQMEEDRKLAEMLQNEENAAASESGERSSRAGTQTQAEDGSWWDTIMTGMGASGTTEESGKRSSEIDISRPPGSSRTLHAASTGTEDEYEREGLLSGNGSSGPRAATVAESKPLFSCVVDSVSNAASAAAAGVSTMTYGEEEEVHGVDTTSFLAIPKVGDDRGSSGHYSAIHNDD